MKQNLIYRLADVMKTTGLRKSTIYKLISKNDFPAPLRLSERAIGWKSSDIDDWVNSRPLVHSISEVDQEVA